MTDFPQPCSQQYFDEDNFHGDSFPAAGTSWGATTLMAPEDSQPAPSSNRHPLLGQPWGHAGVLRDDVVSGCYRMFSHLRGFTRIFRLTSFHQQMLLVIIK